MQKIWWHRIYFSIGFVLIFLTNSLAVHYTGFIELQENKCTLLTDKDLQKLPPAWHKYNGFIKTCALRKNKASKTNVSIVSVWAEDYLDAQKKDIWEDFPVTIIVDDHFNKIGEFPEIYPVNSPVELSVYYGRWKSGIPTEIRIDVSNPAVGGDYYYSPLIWKERDKKYHMKNMEPISGRRPK